MLLYKKIFLSEYIMDIKKYYCENCNFKSNFPSEWIVHIKSKKHERLGKPKTYICTNCNYEGLNHWNLKMHLITQHTTKEERSKQKYYCSVCDKVFFCNTYYVKHNEGKTHKNRILAEKYLRELKI
jgi:hypothetical protein